MAQKKVSRTAFLLVLAFLCVVIAVLSFYVYTYRKKNIDDYEKEIQKLNEQISLADKENHYLEIQLDAHKNALVRLSRDIDSTITAGRQKDRTINELERKFKDADSVYRDSVINAYVESNQRPYRGR